MEKLHIRKIASLGLMLCFFTGVGAQTPVKVEKRKEHKSNTVIPVVKGNVTDTLSLVSFNDFHGAFACDKGVPGAGQLVQTVLTQKEKNKNTIVLSVGDNFSGSYFSRITRGNPLPEMFQEMDVKMSAVGNHEFDWGLPYLTDTAKVYMNFVAANIITDRGDTLEWAKPYRIVTLNLKNGGTVRVAFVGLTTTDTAHKTSPENIKGLAFVHPVYAARVETACRLKKEGKVDMVVLLMHIGTNMKNRDIIEEENAKLLPFLKGVDAIISGHSHEVVLSKVNDVPIIQAGVNGTHIGKLDFRVVKEEGGNRISYIGGDTIRTEGPSNAHIDSLVDKVLAVYGLSEKQILAKDALIHDRTINKWEYTPVGAYVTAAYVRSFLENEKVPAELKVLPVIGVNHFGGLRASIPAGEVTRLRAGNVLPFGGNVVAYEFTGERLKQLLDDGRRNKNGFLQTSYLKLHLNSKGNVETITDCRTNKIIRDDDKCIVVLDAFITSGGDGYDSKLFSGYEIGDFNSQNLETTVAFIDYLKSLKGFVSSEAAPIPIVQK